MSNPVQTAFAILIVLYGTYWLTTSILYFLRRSHEPILSRGIVVPLLQSTYGWIHFLLLCLDFGVPIPCAYSYISSPFLIIFWLYV